MLIYHQNCRGLRTKTSEFCQNLITTSYDIVTLTETWLNSDIATCALFPCQYKVLRDDRDSSKRGGDVAIAIAEHVQFLPVVSDIMDIENVFVKLPQHKGSDILLGCIYLPPSLNVDTIRKSFDLLQDLVFGFQGRILIVGDFNINTLSSNHYNTLKTQLLNDFLAVGELNQLNATTNTSGRTGLSNLRHSCLRRAH